ncbi:MAG TPA: tetratricopeptide repeat protein [Candidatus Obscuribacterales bacterium]
MRHELLTGVILSALLSCSISVSAKESSAQAGREGNWKSSTQGAPSVEASRKRVEQNPKDAIAHNDLGWALRQNNDLKGAEQELREALKLDPGLSYAHSNLSVVLLDTNRAAEAAEEAKTSVQLDAKQPIFRVVYGNALAATGDRKGAIDQYRKAVELRPDYENALYNLGRVLLDDGQSAEAKVVLSQALALDPKDDRVLKILDKIID